MFLGREQRSGLALDEDTMEEMARAALSGLAVRTLGSVRRRISTLSGGSGRSSPSPAPS